LKRLGIATLAAQAGLPTTTMRRYTDQTEIREWLGGEGNPPTFPPEAVELMQAILAKVKDPRFKPGPLKHSLREGIDVRALLLGEVSQVSQVSDIAPPDTGYRIRESENAITPYADPTALASAFAAALVSAARDAGVLPTPHLPSGVMDELLNRQQAASELACTEASVTRYVKPMKGRRDAFRMSDIQHYIKTGDVPPRH